MGLRNIAEKQSESLLYILSPLRMKVRQ